MSAAFLKDRERVKKGTLIPLDLPRAMRDVKRAINCRDGGISSNCPNWSHGHFFLPVLIGVAYDLRIFAESIRCNLQEITTSHEGRRNMANRYANLFQPIKIGKVEIKNRFMLAPIGPGGFCDADGSFNYRGVEFYVERARGGTGLIMTGVTMVENEIEKCSLPSLPCTTLNPINFIKTSKLMTERVHAYGAKIFLQLTAGFGRVSIPSIVGRTAVAPSAIPHRWIPGVICRPLTIDEIKTFIGKFADSAEICQNAGYDGVEIHAVHEGYLLDQFAISFFNQRTDEYGGSLENRLRFTTDIVKAIKARCGQDFPVSLRYSIKSFIKDWLKGGLPGEEFEEKGRDIPEGIEAARMLESAGYDALNGDVGSYDAWYWSHPPMYQEKGLYLPYNEILKKAVTIPIITAGRMDNPALASRAIAEGKTDMIGLARPLLADPEPAEQNKRRPALQDTTLPFLSGRLHGPAREIHLDLLRRQPSVRTGKGVRHRAESRETESDDSRRRCCGYGSGESRGHSRARCRPLRIRKRARGRSHCRGHAGFQERRPRAHCLVRRSVERSWR